MKKLFAISTILLALASSRYSIADIVVSPSNPVSVTSGNSENYVFETGGVLTMTPPGGSVFSGTFSGTGGTINFSATGRAQVRFTKSLSNYAGAINIGGSSWFILSGANATGSAKAAWTVNTTDGGKDTGLLFENTTATSASKPIQLGKLEGNGYLRTLSETEGPYYIQVGSLLTSAADTSTFSGSIRLYNSSIPAKGTFAVEKVGAGTWILSGGNNFTGGLTVTEGTLQLGAGGDNGYISNQCAVTVEKAGAFGYNRANVADKSALNPQNLFTVNGGTIFNAGPRAIQYSKVTFNNGGTIEYKPGGSSMTFQQLDFVGDNASVLKIDNTNAATYIEKLTSSGSGIKEISASGARGNFLYLQGDFSGYTGKISANGDFWISLNGAKNYRSTCFNLNTGTDSGLLLSYDPNVSTGTLILGALEGNGIVRPNVAGVYKIQVGANNADSTFAGGFQTYYGGNFSVEKIGTGTLTFTSSGEKRNSGVLGEYSLNNYSGDTTITEGTFRLGSYDPVAKTGGATGQLNGSSKIVIGENGTLSIARNSAVDYNTQIQSNGGTIEILNAPENSVAFRGSVTGTIVKTGQGSLAIGSDNGANLVQITVKEGALNNWFASRLGNGATKLVLDGGTFAQIQDKETISNPISVPSSGTIKASGNTFNYSGQLSGSGTLSIDVKTLNLSGNNSSFNGTLRLTAGNTTIAAANNVGAATIDFNGGTLTTPVGLSNNINVSANGGKLAISAGGQFFSGKLTGDGVLAQSSNDRGSWFQVQNMDLSDFSGTLTESGNNWVALSNNSGAKMTWNLANTSDSGLLMNHNAATTTYQFGNLTGTGWVRTNNDQASTTYTIEVGAKNEAGTFSGAFRKFGGGDTINVSKVGNETWTLASANQVGIDYNNQANITVKAGTLELARKAGQASAINLTVSESGALLLSTPNQTISGNFSAADLSVLQVDVSAFESPDYNSLTQAALLKVVGTTTVSANASVDFLFNEENFRPGFEVDFGLDDIISGYTVPTSELLASLDKYLVEGTNISLLMPLYSDGAISGVAFNSEGVPEPSSWILLVLGCAGLLQIRRLRR